MGLLDGKVALVTGAGHGIGRGHALELARAGAKVVVNDLGSSVSGEGAGRDADRVVEIIESFGAEAVADYGDVSDEAQAAAMVGEGHRAPGAGWTSSSTTPGSSGTELSGTWRSTISTW